MSNDFLSLRTGNLTREARYTSLRVWSSAGAARLGLSERVAYAYVRRGMRPIVAQHACRIELSIRCAIQYDSVKHSTLLLFGGARDVVVIDN